MKIKSAKKAKQMAFADLEMGDVFLHNDEAYIATDTGQAVHLESGALEDFEDEEMAIPLPNAVLELNNG